jgi:hypothetical protein
MRQLNTVSPLNGLASCASCPRVCSSDKTTHLVAVDEHQITLGCRETEPIDRFPSTLASGQRASPQGSSWGFGVGDNHAIGPRLTPPSSIRNNPQSEIPTLFRGRAKLKCTGPRMKSQMCFFCFLLFLAHTQLGCWRGTMLSGRTRASWACCRNTPHLACVTCCTLRHAPCPGQNNVKAGTGYWCCEILGT